MRNIFISVFIFILSLILFFDYTVIDGFASINTNSINFKSMTIDDGLSQSSIYSIFQDSKGYMWIGTGDGLNKYNAHDFEVYRSSKSDENTLSNNVIIDIKEDSKGNIWVGTVAGLNKIDSETNKVTRYLPNEKGCNISHYRIREILISTSGEILVATDDGLNKYDEENDNFIRVYDSNNEKDSLSNQTVYSIVEDSYGNYWVGTVDGLNKINNKSGKIEKYFNDKSNENTISLNFIYRLYADDKGYLWVGTYYGGLDMIDLSSGKIERFFPSKDEKSIPGAYIRDILRDSKGNMWVATDFGFASFNEESKTFRRYESLEYDNESIISDDILSVCEDSSGMIWIGTRNGISMFNDNNIFTNYKSDPFNNNSLSEKSVSGIYEDEDGLIWIGTVHNGINILDRKNNEIKKLDTIKEDGEKLTLSNNLVREIVGIDNEVWIATQNGLNKYDKLDDTITFFKEEDGLINNDIFSLCIDRSGLLWIGTVSGICSYDRNGKFKEYSKELKDIGVESAGISSIYEDSNGDIYFSAGREYGIIKYNRDSFERFTVSEEGEKSYSAVYSINSNDDQYLWVGTENGLIKINKESKEQIIYDEENGLANSFIYGILFDDKGDIWLSSNLGISKFDLSENKFINFDATDGIQSNEFNQYSYYKNSSGEMFFGGINGLTIFSPEKLIEKSFIPKVQIQSISTNFNSVGIEDRLKFSYRENQLKFEFFMPDYSNPRNLQYAYKLEGLEEEWVFSDNKNYANYINLSPGNYVFKVKGRNSSGQWSELNSISITIKNPPWKTPIAYLIYVLIFITIILIIWNRVKLLDNLVKQRTLELNKKLIENENLYKMLLKHEKHKNNYFVNLSHELRTPLNLIASTQQLISKLNEKEKYISKDKINIYMNIIKGNSNRLIKLIDNIINTSKIESGNYKLKITKRDIVYLVEEITLSMKEEIEQQGINLTVDPEMEEKIIECDESDIKKIIMNLISNAIKFTDAGGKIYVTISDLGDKVKIEVEDTGIGIERNKHEAIFNRFDQEYKTTSEEYGGCGLGLTLTKQLVELHGGTVNVVSEIGKGSKFIVILPEKQSN